MFIDKKYLEGSIIAFIVNLALTIGTTFLGFYDVDDFFIRLAFGSVVSIATICIILKLADFLDKDRS